MQDHEDRGGQVLREGGQQVAQRLDAAGGRADHHHVTLSHVPASVPPPVRACVPCTLGARPARYGGQTGNRAGRSALPPPSALASVADGEQQRPPRRTPRSAHVPIDMPER
ncbi:hypothetical protein GCM10027451_51090 [Geodermatophilus aquaeductus]